MEIFQYEFAIRALLASSLVGILCGLLGCFIILRNMALIGDALSHAILPGVVVGFLLTGYSLTGFFSGAVVAGLIAAVLITWLQENLKTREDAAIGIVFTFMFAIGVMAISWLSRSEGVHLDMQDFLFGNVLAISNMDLILTAGIALFVVTGILGFYRYFFVTTFQPVISRSMGISVSTMHYFMMLLLSFSVVASIQTVGVILVVAMLIIPASTAYLISNRLQHMLAWSAFFGLLAAVSGLMVAIFFETTPGPAMTVAGAVVYFFIALAAPRSGFIMKKVNKYRRRRSIETEDVIKLSARLYENDTLNIDKLAEYSGLSQKRIKKTLKRLRRRGMLEYKSGFSDIRLSSSGQKRAYELIRAHRLWETYLSNKLGLPGESLHAHAEEYEHRLPESLVDEMDKHLGHPKTDPHGSPIPRKGGSSDLTLIELGESDRVMAATNQPDDKTARILWEMGITPNSILEIVRIDDTTVHLAVGEQNLQVSRELAARIVVGKV